MKSLRCTCPGDVCKAFGAGADFVMLGGTCGVCSAELVLARWDPVDDTQECQHHHEAHIISYMYGDVMWFHHDHDYLAIKPARMANGSGSTTIERWVHL